LRFSLKRQDGSAPNFFEGLRNKKHLFITTCIEKHYTWPLNSLNSKAFITKNSFLKKFEVVLVLWC